MPLTARFASGAIHRANLKPLSRLNTRNKLHRYRVVQGIGYAADRTLGSGAIHRANLKPLSRLNMRNKLRRYRLGARHRICR